MPRHYCSLRNAFSPWDEKMTELRAGSGVREVRTRTYADVAQPLYTHAIGRWRHYAQWLEPHLRSMAPLLKEFGYE